MNFRQTGIVLTLAWSALLSGLGPVLARPGEQPGAQFVLRPETMPKPYATPAVANPPLPVARPAGAKPLVPHGFAVNVFAEDLDNARWLAVAPNGDVFLAEPDGGKVTVLRDGDGDGVAETRATFIEGLSRPHGMAFYGDMFFVADTEGLWRMPYRTGALEASEPPVRITTPDAFGPIGNHWTRNIAIAPDGKSIFVAIGSFHNVAEEAPPQATVQRFDIDGTGQTTFATGLRNPVGIAFYPGTDDLYVVVNERDGLGDKLVPDYLTRIREGQFFGYPYAYIGAHPDPQFGGKNPARVAETVVPDVLFASHSAPLGLVFYDGAMFPEEYRGDAFVAFHGSWNSGRPTGYKVVRVRFRDGRPARNAYENFMTGFWSSGSRPPKVWGRPVGLAVAKDGSLLVADDAGDRVWRVSVAAKKS